MERGRIPHSLPMKNLLIFIKEPLYFSRCESIIIFDFYIKICFNITSFGVPREEAFRYIRGFIFYFYSFHFMNTQKIQASTRGFTLVELIVVITILVILGTIAFINLGGMSASARDSQRTSDLGQINKQIMILQAKNGVSYTNMLSGTTTNTLTAASGANLGGTGVTANSYIGGDVNYSVLGIDQTKFQDPISKVAYKMGATTLAGGSYELAAKLEETTTALVLGTFKSRNATTGTITSTGANNLITLSTADIGKFFVGDIVGNGAYTGTINKVVVNGTNGVSITLSTGTTTTGSLRLGATDTLGLIKSITTSSQIPVIDKGADLPY